MKTVLLVYSILLISCHNNQKSSNITQIDQGSQKAMVREVIQTTAYTYLWVDKGGVEEWIAINKQEVKKGTAIYYSDGLKMENFTSPELNRTFESVYFVQEISDHPIERNMHGGMTGSQPQKPVLSKLDIQIEQPEGGVSIGELYANRESYSGKMIKVKGQVTKVNLAIMNRNWVHIQDGTSNGDDFDLTITTDHEPKVGEVLTFTGTLVLNKDFGSGYSYELLLEAALPLEHL